LAIFCVGDVDEGGCKLFKVSTGEDVGEGEEGVAADLGIEVIGMDGHGVGVEHGVFSSGLWGAEEVAPHVVRRV